VPATVIIGGQWGDEGKAKIVDYLMPDHDVVVRYQGGANAGHTVVTDNNRFAFHQIPSGVLTQHVTAIMGNGMVIDPHAFLDELRDLLSKEIFIEERLFISSAAHVVMPFHRVLDNLFETELKEASIGSTGKGIGPSYCDKFSRRGIRMGDFLLGKEQLFEKVKQRVAQNNRLLEIFGAPPLSPKKVASDFVNIKDLIEHFVTDTQAMLWRMRSEGKRILLEGAQGTLLDIDHGSFPFVTSSSCTVGGALTGTGLVPSDIGRVIGIFKAYITRVGNGPFPTELDDEIGEELKERGNEYGTTTGRPRRCGWMDLVAAKYAVGINGFKEIALTKLDVLSGIPEVKLCTSYSLEGREITDFPQNAEMLMKCEPVYTSLPGWGDGALDVDSFGKLPGNVINFIETIERELGVEVTFISKGPDRRDTIVRDPAYSVDSPHR